MLIQFGVDEPSGGPLVMMVEGGVTSGPRTSHSYSAGVRSVQPNSLIACTMNSWSPSSSGPTVNGDSQKTYGSPSIEHWAIALGWSTQNSKVAEPLFEVGMPSGPSGPSGPEMIEVSGIIPEEAAAIAKSPGKFSASPQTLAGVVNGLFMVVTSSQSSPSKWSSRAEGVSDPNCIGL